MAKYNTGNASATTVTIDKKTSNGVSLNGYPKNYSLLNAFTGNAAITQLTFAELSDNERNTRRTAFITYVNGVEGVSIGSIQTNAPTKSDVTLCPIQIVS